MPKKYGQAMPCHPSPLLKKIPEELIEHADEKGKEPVAAESGKSMSLFQNPAPAEGSRPTSTGFGPKSCRPRALTRRSRQVLKEAHMFDLMRAAPD